MPKKWVLLSLCVCFLCLAVQVRAVDNDKKKEILEQLPQLGPPEDKKPIGAQDFFPLSQGWEWVYSVTAYDPAGKEVSKERLTIKNLASVELEGKKVYPQEYRRKSVNTFYYAQESKGIAAIAVKQGAEGKPNNFEHPLYMFITPLAKGTEVTSGELKLVIDDLKDTVTVPAGTFNNCVKITTINTKNNEEITAWFAEGVGRLKSVIKRPDGRKSEILLESYKK